MTSAVRNIDYIEYFIREPNVIVHFIYRYKPFFVNDRYCFETSKGHLVLSERETQIEEDLTADIIIPNLRTLKKKPDKAIIIQIVEDDAKQDKILRLEVLRPNYQNIWAVYPKTTITTKYT